VSFFLIFIFDFCCQISSSCRELDKKRQRYVWKRENIFSLENLYFVGNSCEAHLIVCKSSLKLAERFCRKWAMAHAGACAKGNRLMRIYVRAHVNQFANLYLRRRPAPCHFERSHWRRVSSLEKYREGTILMRCARQSVCGWKIEMTKKKRSECNKHDDGWQQQSCPQFRRAHVNLTSKWCTFLTSGYLYVTIIYNEMSSYGKEIWKEENIYWVVTRNGVDMYIVSRILISYKWLYKI